MVTYPSGLHLRISVRLTGTHAVMARRGDERTSGGDRGAGSDPYSFLYVVAAVDGHRYELMLGRCQTSAVSSTAGESYASDGNYWVSIVPADGRLLLTTAWPQVGLPSVTTALALTVPGL